VKFVLLVEGKTERKVLPSFLGRWLNEQLGRRVGVRPDEVSGLKDLKTKAVKYIDAPRSDDIIAVVGLLDIYGFMEIERRSRPVDEFCNSAANEITSSVSRPEFRMFFAVHELEAWLLSQPDVLPPEIKKALPGNAGDPESVDFDEPPSKLLTRLYREKRRSPYRKVIDGASLFSKLDPRIAYDKCPNLRAMLDWMLDRAQKAIDKARPS
jgi:hypothetical protein